MNNSSKPGSAFFHGMCSNLRTSDIYTLEIYRFIYDDYIHVNLHTFNGTFQYKHHPLMQFSKWFATFYKNFNIKRKTKNNTALIEIKWWGRRGGGELQLAFKTESLNWSTFYIAIFNRTKVGRWESDPMTCISQSYISLSQISTPVCMHFQMSIVTLFLTLW